MLPCKLGADLTEDFPSCCDQGLHLRDILLNPPWSPGLGQPAGHGALHLLQPGRALPGCSDICSSAGVCTTVHDLPHLVMRHADNICLRGWTLLLFNLQYEARFKIRWEFTIEPCLVNCETKKAILLPQKSNKLGLLSESTWIAGACGFILCSGLSICQGWAVHASIFRFISHVRRISFVSGCTNCPR